MDTNDAPGQGHGIKENIEHVINTAPLDLAFNVEPANFKEDIDNHFNGNQELQYQFFQTNEPKNLVNGVGQSIYNISKGVIAGTTVLVVAPVNDTISGFNESNYEGVKGIGLGIYHGLHGSVSLSSAGVCHGTSQLLRSITSNENLPASVDAINSIKTDLYHVTRTPIYRIINGYQPSEKQESVLEN
jgi:hypothetical protein